MPFAFRCSSFLGLNLISLNADTHLSPSISRSVHSDGQSASRWSGRSGWDLLRAAALMLR